MLDIKRIYATDNSEITKLFKKVPLKKDETSVMKLYQLTCKGSASVNYTETEKNKLIRIPIFTLSVNKTTIYIPKYDLYNVDIETPVKQLEEYFGKFYAKFLATLSDQGKIVIVRDIVLPRFIAVQCPTYVADRFVLNSLPKIVSDLYIISKSKDEVAVDALLSPISKIKLMLDMYNNINNRFDILIEYLSSNIEIFLEQVLEMFKYFLFSQKGLNVSQIKDEVHAKIILYILHHFISPLMFPNLTDQQREQIINKFSKRLNYKFVYNPNYIPTLGNLFSSISKLDKELYYYQDVTRVFARAYKIHPYLLWTLSNIYGMLHTLIANQFNIQIMKIPLLSRFITLQLPLKRGE